MGVSRTNQSIVSEAVASALRGVAPDIEQRTPGRWDFSLSNGVPSRMGAHVHGDEWLEFVTSLKSPVADVDGCLLLDLNTRFSGSARVALGSDGRVQLRSEAFIGTDQADDNVRDERYYPNIVCRLCEDIRLALDRLHDASLLTRAGDVVGLQWPWTTYADDSASVTAGLCADAGWAATPRSNGEVTVPIMARGASFQARIARCADGNLLAMVPFGNGEVARWSPESQAAIATLLLRVGGSVRLVKGVLVRHQDTAVPGIAAAIGPVRTAGDLGRALAALTLGCALAGREALALGDNAIARAYLALDQGQKSLNHL